MVANERKPMTLNEMYQTLPEVYQDLNKYQETLERHFRDMQEIEFTVQNGTLYLLETRKGRRQANAAVKIAVSMVEEGLITEREALLRIDPDQMTFFLRPMIDPEVIATGFLVHPHIELSLKLFYRYRLESTSCRMYRKWYRCINWSLNGSGGIH